MGIPATLPEFATEMLGTLPTIRDGLVMTPVGNAAEETVAIDDVELDRAGDVGLTVTNEAAGGGDGAVKELAESRWRCCDPAKGEGGAKRDVGVGAGVFWLEEMAVPGTTGCLRLGTSPM